MNIKKWDFTIPFFVLYMLSDGEFHDFVTNVKVESIDLVPNSAKVICKIERSDFENYYLQEINE